MSLTVNAKKSESFEYVPVNFRGEDAPFKVTIKRIDSRTFTKLEDGLTKLHQEDATISFASGSFNWQVLKRGVTGWENIFDADGAPIKFVKDSSGLMDDSCIEFLPFELITEIATTISSITRTPEHTDIFLGKTSIASAK